MNDWQEKYPDIAKGLQRVTERKLGIKMEPRLKTPRELEEGREALRIAKPDLYAKKYGTGTEPDWAEMIKPNYRK